MKFSLWTNNGALNSKPVFEAFATGANLLGHTVSYNDVHADVDVIWSVLWHGRMSPNKEIWDKAQKENRPIIVLEVGGINRGTTWKVGLNGINRDAYFGGLHNNSSRADALGIFLKPWRFNNEQGDIIIACQHNKSHQWRNQTSVQTWLYESIDLIRQYTNRKIIVRPHPRCPIPGIEYKFKNVEIKQPKPVQGTYDDFDFDPADAYAVVNWSSNPATQAVMMGVPVFVGPDSLAYDVGNTSLATINCPKMPDRTQWRNDIAHTEWRIEEISQGMPIKRLTSKL
tara:strand:+ start:2441 stop:3292 length:852 start_codon:yes stop_codon:yes gene_type:complete